MTNTTTPLADVIKELRELLAKATPHEKWEWSGRKVSKFPNEPAYVRIPECSTLGNTTIMMSSDADENCASNCDLVAAALNALPQLLTAAEKAERYERALREIKNIGIDVTTTGSVRRVITMREVAEQALAPEQEGVKG